MFKTFAALAVTLALAVPAFAQHRSSSWVRPGGNHGSSNFVHPGSTRPSGGGYSSTFVDPSGNVTWDPHTYLPNGQAVYDPYDQLGHQTFIPGQAPIWTPPAYNPWTDPMYQP